MDAHDGSSRKLPYHRQVSANLIDPVHRRSRILRKRLYQCRIVDILAAGHGILHEELYAVLDACRFLITCFSRVQSAG